MDKEKPSRLDARRISVFEYCFPDGIGRIWWKNYPNNPEVGKELLNLTVQSL